MTVLSKVADTTTISTPEKEKTAQKQTTESMWNGRLIAVLGLGLAGVALVCIGKYMDHKAFVSQTAADKHYASFFQSASSNAPVRVEEQSNPAFDDRRQVERIGLMQAERMNVVAINRAFDPLKGQGQHLTDKAISDRVEEIQALSQGCQEVAREVLDGPCSNNHYNWKECDLGLSHVFSLCQGGAKRQVEAFQTILCTRVQKSLNEDPPEGVSDSTNAVYRNYLGRIDRTCNSMSEAWKNHSQQSDGRRVQLTDISAYIPRDPRNNSEAIFV